MHCRFSKLAKAIIIINVLLTISGAIINGYNVYRIEETNTKIVKFMEENKVIRATAIRMLEKDGEELFINTGSTAYIGVFLSILTLFLLIKYSKYNGFFFGFSAAICGVFTTFVGGLLLFYVILSGKSEIGGKRKRYSLKDEWEEYINERSNKIYTTKFKA